MSTPHSFCEMDYSPPAKRAPILRRIPLKLDIPLQHPPAIPLKEYEEEHSYMEPICQRIKVEAGDEAIKPHSSQHLADPS
nr:unnamed protein product [Haemonchus contortus]